MPRLFFNFQSVDLFADSDLPVEDIPRDAQTEDRGKTAEYRYKDDHGFNESGLQQ
jgi:hypothetical protein